MLWAAVRTRGCQFLGPAVQEAALKYILLSPSYIWTSWFCVVPRVLNEKQLKIELEEPQREQIPLVVEIALYMDK